MERDRKDPIEDIEPLTDESGASLGASASRTGKRTRDDTDDIGGTDEMGASTGGLAGTSR